MRHMRLGALLVGVLVLLVAVRPALAHHSVTAEFNIDKNFTVKGVLTRVEWTNPHTYIYLNATDEQGKTVEYTFETTAPSTLHRAGFRKDDIKIGDTVTITASPAKDGTKTYGYLKMIKFSDGHVFVHRDGSE